MALLFQAGAIDVVLTVAARDVSEQEVIRLVQIIVEGNVYFEEGQMIRYSRQLLHLLLSKSLLLLLLDCKVVLGLSEILRIQSGALLRFLHVAGIFGDLIFAKLVQVDHSLDNGDRGRRNGVQVLNHIPFSKLVCKQVQALNHFLTIGQRQVCDGHVHITGFECKTRHEGAELLDLWDVVICAWRSLRNQLLR